jgi:hypothetical protein
MARVDAQTFNSTPYFDDFDEDNNYVRILFRPEYPVQARELTQIQTIIHDQIRKFGDHIFKDGSPVIGGELTLDTTNVTFIKLLPIFGNEDVELDNFVGRKIVSPNGRSTATVLTSYTSTVAGSFPTLIVKMLSGAFESGQTISTTGVDTSRFQATIATTTNPIGKSSTLSIGEGVFYVDGYFVQVAPSIIPLDPYGTAPNFRIGLEIDDSIVTASQDSTLLDPAVASANFQAPGANRYKFGLRLTKRNLSSSDDLSFFELGRIENGTWTRRTDNAIYNKLEENLARRTFDESGDYTVRNFRATLTANTKDATGNTYIINLTPGKAYVKGFEFETIGATQLLASKARDKQTSTDFDLNIEYGNYLYVANVQSSNQGFFNFALPTVDLHCVNSANVDRYSYGTYSNTKIGTAKVRNFDRESSTSYLLYICDANVQPLTFTTVSATPSTITLPDDYSQYNNAYTNAIVTISSTGDSRLITNYVGSSKVATVTPPFTSVPSGTARIDFSIKDLNSVTYAPSATDFNWNSLTSVHASMDIHPDSKDLTSNTYLTDTNLNTMVFRLGQNYLANGSITNADYYHRKVLRNLTFTSNGQITLSDGGGHLSTGEFFTFGRTNSFVSDTQANTDLIVIVRGNTGSTVYANGSIIDLTTGTTGVFQTNEKSITIYTGAAAAITADIILTVKVDDTQTESVARRRKTVVGNTSNTVLTTSDTPLNGSTVGAPIGASVRIDGSRGHIWFTSAGVIETEPGIPMSLYVPDVLQIIRIYDSGDINYAPNTTNAIDITNHYYLDGGQRDNFYDHASIILKPGYNAPKGQMVVFCKYYDHSAGASSGYFNVDSYPITEYASGAIPIYYSQSGGYYNLRDCVDFRPTRTPGQPSFTYIGSRVQKPSEVMELSYQFYLPRIDKLMLTKDKEFKVVRGISSITPVPPSDAQDAMTLYIINSPAYAANVSEIKLEYVENRRYTMRDIGTLEKRIESLENYTALTQIEALASDTAILYEDNLREKEKYGIVVDTFEGFLTADITSDDFLASIE